MRCHKASIPVALKNTGVGNDGATSMAYRHAFLGVRGVPALISGPSPVLAYHAIRNVFFRGFGSTPGTERMWRIV